jgi:hypothetical protein
MSTPRLDIVILGLSITSSWGNGHATMYRGLVQALVARGHSVLFLERDVPWYAEARDLPMPPYGRTELYTGLDDLQDRFTTAVQRADVVMIGSCVPDGVVLGTWVTQTATGVTAFYDIDTPVTLAKLHNREYDYLSPALIPRYDLYLSFTGGPTLTQLEGVYGAAKARPLYCAVDPLLYALRRVRGPMTWAIWGPIVLTDRRLCTVCYSNRHGTGRKGILPWSGRNTRRLSSGPPTSHVLTTCRRQHTAVFTMRSGLH